MKRVITFGSFDILHPGHIYFFKQAKKYGDYLFVVVARDKTIEKIKGRKPLYDETKRREAVQKIRIVNKAVLGDLEDPYKIIERVHPDVICLGYDQESFVDNLEAELKKRHLHPKIVKLKPYRPEQYKSSKFKWFLHHYIVVTNEKI